jgi:hypothetical protein
MRGSFTAPAFRMSRTWRCTVSQLLRENSQHFQDQVGVFHDELFKLVHFKHNAVGLANDLCCFLTRELAKSGFYAEEFTNLNIFARFLPRYPGLWKSGVRALTAIHRPRSPLSPAKYTMEPPL